MLQVTLEDQTYRWNGKVWLDSDYLQVPEKLAILLSDRFLMDLIDLSQPGWASQCSRLRQGMEQASAATLTLVERACRRRLRDDPNDLAAATILCSCLRQLGQSRQAVAVTEPMAHRNEPVLLTTRAAALCDAGRWSEAEATISRAMALGGGDHARQVRFRIVAYRAAGGLR